MTKPLERHEPSRAELAKSARGATVSPLLRPRSVNELPMHADAVYPHRLTPPRTTVFRIERTALIALIEKNLSGQVVAVSAPGGFGKTEILAQCHERMSARNRCVCWMTLEEADGDPKIFLHDLAVAIWGTIKSTGRHPPISVPGADAEIEDLMSTLHELQSLAPEPLLILLDDFHVPAGSGLRNAFDLLLRRLAPNAQILLASRGKPDISAARLRVRGLLAEVNADDLTFDRAELRRLFAGLVTEDEIQQLIDMTGGWPALVQLSRLALSDNPTRSDRENVFSGNHPLLRDFLEEEVLATVPAGVRQALCVCSVSDTFPAELFAALVEEESTGIDPMLVDRLSPILQKLSNREGWLRMVPVLRSTLRAASATELTEAYAKLHARSASWFAERGIFDRAVSHAGHGGNLGAAVESIRKAGGINVFLRVGYTVLRRLLSDLSSEKIYDYPELRLCYALMLSKEGQIQLARDVIEGLKVEGPETTGISPRDLAHIEELIEIYEDKNLDEEHIAGMLRATRDLSRYNTWDRGWFYNHLCIAYQRKGDLRAARFAGLKALSCYREEGSSYPQIFMLGHLGTLHVMAGRLSAAAGVLRQAEEIVQKTQWTDINISALVNIPRSACLYHQGDVAAAFHLLSTSMSQVTRGEGWVDVFAMGFLTLAKVQFLRNGLDAALAVLDDGEVLAIERSLPRLERLIDIARIGLMTRGGQFDLAWQLLERLPPLVITETGAADLFTPRERHEALCAKARLLVRTGSFEDGLAVANALIASADDAGMGLDVLAGRAIAVEALWGLGRIDEASNQLTRAIAAAIPEKATQFLRDGDAQMAAVLRALVRRVGLAKISPEGVAFLAAILGPLHPKRVGELSSSAEVILTRREAEVLVTLSQGASNKRIATLLDTTEGAVKFHMKNLFRKLGVSRRVLAVSVAREIGLIPSSRE